MELENIYFEYNKGKRNKQLVFADFSIKFNEGFNVITGSSGCGKSTLLHIAGGLIPPDSGRVIMDGVIVNKLPSNAKAKFINQNVAFIFQNFYLDNMLSILDNIALPMMIRNIKYSELLKRAEANLEKVGLAGIGDKFPSELSGGECQRVCLARALITEPKYLFADEPTGNLDEINSNLTVDLLHKFATDGKIVVMVTHDKSLIRERDEVHNLTKGTINNGQAFTN